MVCYCLVWEEGLASQPWMRLGNSHTGLCIYIYIYIEWAQMDNIWQVIVAKAEIDHNCSYKLKKRKQSWAIGEVRERFVKAFIGPL